MYQASEVVDLIMVVAITPLLWFGQRTVTVAGKRWFISAYLAISSAFVFTVLEGFMLPDAFNLLEHASYAAGGICLAIAVRTFTMSVRREARIS